MSGQRWRSPDGITVSAIEVANPIRIGSWSGMYRAGLLVIRAPSRVVIAEVPDEPGALDRIAAAVGGLAVEP